MKPAVRCGTALARRDAGTCGAASREGDRIARSATPFPIPTRLTHARDATCWDPVVQPLAQNHATRNACCDEELLTDFSLTSRADVLGRGGGGTVPRTTWHDPGHRSCCVSDTSSWLSTPDYLPNPNANLVGCS